MEFSLVIGLQGEGGMWAATSGHVAGQAPTEKGQEMGDSDQGNSR